MNRNLLGVMQGRLLPKYKGRYQAHPVGYWQDEFELASGLGLDLIEWIFDFNDADINPLSSDAGIRLIREVSAQTGVSVQTICADYFMEAPLHSANSNTSRESLKVLVDLIPRAAKLGVTNIVIPCVDQSKLSDNGARGRFFEAIKQVLPTAATYRLFLCLETDLAPEPFRDLLSEIDSPFVTVNYDTGNSASCGFDPVKELAAYGDRITDVHIKDRKLGGSSVALGTGDTKFPEFMRGLQARKYKGPFIMQAYREDEGLKIFEQQLVWARQLLSEWGFGSLES